MNIRTFVPERFERSAHLMAFGESVDSPDEIALPEPGENATEPAPELSDAERADHGLSPLGPNERDDDDEDR